MPSAKMGRIRIIRERATFLLQRGEDEARSAGADAGKPKKLALVQLDQVFEIGDFLPFEYPNDATGKIEVLKAHFATLRGRVCRVNASQESTLSEGQPALRLHDLRPTFASHLIIDLRIDVAQVSRILGHSRRSITLDTYTHLFGIYSTFSSVQP